MTKFRESLKYFSKNYKPNYVGAIMNALRTGAGIYGAYKSAQVASAQAETARKRTKLEEERLGLEKRKYETTLAELERMNQARESLAKELQTQGMSPGMATAFAYQLYAPRSLAEAMSLEDLKKGIHYETRGKEASVERTEASTEGQRLANEATQRQMEARRNLADYLRESGVPDAVAGAFGSAVPPGEVMSQVLFKKTREAQESALDAEREKSEFYKGIFGEAEKAEISPTTSFLVATGARPESLAPDLTIRMMEQGLESAETDQRLKDLQVRLLRMNYRDLKRKPQEFRRVMEDLSETLAQDADENTLVGRMNMTWAKVFSKVSRSKNPEVAMSALAPYLTLYQMALTHTLRTAGASGNDPYSRTVNKLLEAKLQAAAAGTALKLGTALVSRFVDTMSSFSWAPKDPFQTGTDGIVLLNDGFANSLAKAPPEDVEEFYKAVSEVTGMPVPALVRMGPRVAIRYANESLQMHNEILSDLRRTHALGVLAPESPLAFPPGPYGPIQGQ